MLEKRVNIRSSVAKNSNRVKLLMFLIHGGDWRSPPANLLALLDERRVKRCFYWRDTPHFSLISAARMARSSVVPSLVFSHRLVSSWNSNLIGPLGTKHAGTRKPAGGGSGDSMR